MDPSKAEFLIQAAPMIIAVVAIAMTAWVVTTWMRIKHGYPLDNGMGEALHPKVDRETNDQIKLLNQENAQLRDELAGLKDRLANVERIVTDSGYSLDQEIGRLRDTAK